MDNNIADQLEEILAQKASASAKEWIAKQQQALQQQPTIHTFIRCFTQAPRFVGKDLIELDEREQSLLRPLLASTYSLDQLFRIYWLCLYGQLVDQQTYVSQIKQLCLTAEMNELVAIYKALPVLPYPESWVDQTAEGIRSNIGIVLEAIMCQNPYPAQYLSEQAWNQLVLKAFFTDKPIAEIVGLDARANASLADTLIDLSRERRAAGRTVHPLLWRVVAPFMKVDYLPDIQRTLHDERLVDRQAAVLVVHNWDDPEAAALHSVHREIWAQVEAGALNWDNF